MMLEFALFMVLYVVPLVASACIFGYFLFRDVREYLDHDDGVAHVGEGEDGGKPYQVTLRDALVGVLLCTLPIINWVIPFRFVWDLAHDITGRLLMTPIVHRRHPHPPKEESDR